MSSHEFCQRAIRLPAQSACSYSATGGADSRIDSIQSVCLNPWHFSPCALPLLFQPFACHLRHMMQQNVGGPAVSIDGSAMYQQFSLAQGMKRIDAGAVAVAVVGAIAGAAGSADIADVGTAGSADIDVGVWYN